MRKWLIFCAISVNPVFRCELRIHADLQIKIDVKPPTFHILLALQNTP